MFGSVPTVPRSLDQYAPMVSPMDLDRLAETARPLVGVSIRFLGGHDPEDTREASWLVPLLRSLGIRAEWFQSRGAEELEHALRHLRSAVGGNRVAWPRRHGDTWRRYNEVNADLWEDDDGLVVVDGLEAAGVRLLLEERGGKEPHGTWLWRSHLDLAHADDDLVDFLMPYLSAFDQAIWSDPGYGLPGVARSRVVAPAIDPLATRNLDLSEEAGHAIISALGVDPTRPLICQVGFPGGSADALGAISVWDALRSEIVGLQILLLGPIVGGSAEGGGETAHEACLRRAHGSSDVHLVAEPGNLVINAAQRSSMVVLQYSEGPPAGLEVAEAAWKSRPVVAGPVAPAWGQISDGITGFVATTAADLAARTGELLLNPDASEELGREGHSLARSRFLLPRAMLEHLEIFTGV